MLTLDNDTLNQIFDLFFLRHFDASGVTYVRLVEPPAVAFKSYLKIKAVCKRLRTLVLERLDAKRAQYARFVAWTRDDWITQCVRKADQASMFKFMCHHGKLRIGDQCLTFWQKGFSDAHRPVTVRVSTPLLSMQLHYSELETPMSAREAAARALLEASCASTCAAGSPSCLVAPGVE